MWSGTVDQALRAQAQIDSPCRRTGAAALRSTASLFNPVIANPMCSISYDPPRQLCGLYSSRARRRLGRSMRGHQSNLCLHSVRNLNICELPQFSLMPSQFACQPEDSRSASSKPAATQAANSASAIAKDIMTCVRQPPGGPPRWHTRRLDRLIDHIRGHCRRQHPLRNLEHQATERRD